MVQKYLAYEGEEFTIEWYFNDKGRSEAREYYELLPLSQQKKIMHLFFVLAEMGKIRNEEKFRYEGDQIYVFKANPDRFFCFFFDGSKVIVTNAYEKKTAKMPVREKEKSLKAKDDYIARYKKKVYYDKN